MILRQTILGLLASIVCTIACTNNRNSENNSSNTDSLSSNASEEAPAKLYPIADTSWQDYTISVLSEHALTSKYETLYIKVQDKEGKPADDLDLDFVPTMDMGMMSHGGPYSPPKRIGTGLYRGSVVFIMANMDGMGKGWILHTILKQHNKVDTLTFRLPVTQADPVRTSAVNTVDDGRIFVSLLADDTLKTGKQAVHFSLHKIDGDHYPIAEGYEIQVEPFMSAMGHGSAENKNGQEVAPGQYEGIANFSMAGNWELKVNILKNGKQISQETLVFPVAIK